MIERLKFYVWVVRNWLRGDYEGGRVCYGQFAEDILIFEALRSRLGTYSTREIRYLDVGANHPSRLSNTMFFYVRGGNGVLIEPNSTLAKLLERRRPRDLVLNIGVASQSCSDLPFFLMQPDVLSTFSRAAADQYQALGYELEREIVVPVVGINEIILKHFPAKSPEVFSLDVEGLDEEILAAIDWRSFTPLVICVETWDMGARRESSGIVRLISDQGYSIYAKAGPNTIFLRDAPQGPHASDRNKC